MRARSVVVVTALGYALALLGCEKLLENDYEYVLRGEGGHGGGPTSSSNASSGPGSSGGGTTTTASAGGGSVGGAGGAGGSGTGGAGGGVGGAGGAGGCMSPADCPAGANECVAATCNANTCGTVNVADGTELGTQVPGDCRHDVCNGAGEVATGGEAEADVFDDMNECTDDSCMNGNQVHAPKATGEPCAQNGGKKCNAGACVECVNGLDCMAPELCQSNKCVPATCGNVITDGTETDQDCGGADCGPCDSPKACLVGSDCKSLVCSGLVGMMKCKAATCADMTRNQGEVDVDCGGPCGDCATGKACLKNTDCISDNCGAGVCQQSCKDGSKTGAETDVDCGGLLCPKCADTKTCVNNSDCASGVCMAGVCEPGGAGGAGGGGGAGGAGGN